MYSFIWKTIYILINLKLALIKEYKYISRWN